MRRQLLVLICALFATATGSATAAQESEPPGFGLGGRAMVPEAGFAITFPDDWAYVRPAASNHDPVGGIDPGLVSVLKSVADDTGVVLLATPPFAPSDGFAENCNVAVTFELDGESLESIADQTLSFYGVVLDITSGPELSMLDFPVGDVARIDMTHLSEGQEIVQTQWLYYDGHTEHALTCTDNLEHPDGAWRSIAEAFEYLPAE
jgi:hypothetical protein